MSERKRELAVGEKAFRLENGRVAWVEIIEVNVVLRGKPNQFVMYRIREGETPSARTKEFVSCLELYAEEERGELIKDLKQEIKWAREALEFFEAGLTPAETGRIWADTRSKEEETA